MRAPHDPFAGLKAIWRSRARRIVVPVLALIAAAWLIAHLVRGFSWPLFVSALRATPPWGIIAAVVMTPLSYLCLSVTEWFSLHSLGHRLSWPRTVRVAVAAYTVSNSLGFSLATGTATRLRLYGAAGLGPGAVTATALVAGTAVTLSGVVAAGLGLVIEPTVFAQAIHTRPDLIRIVGVILLSPALLWFIVLRAPRAGTQPLVRSHAGRALALLAGLADWALSGAALYILSPDASLTGFPVFLTVFVLGSVVSAATGVPGGIGVFEAVVLGLSALTAQTHQSPTALILYRVIYSLGPLVLISLALGAERIIRPRRPGTQPT